MDTAEGSWGESVMCKRGAKVLPFVMKLKYVGNIGRKRNFMLEILTGNIKVYRKYGVILGGGKINLRS